MGKAGITKNQKGFTLVEVIIVLVILSIIASIAIPSTAAYMKKTKQMARMETARAIFMVSQTAFTHEKNIGGEIIADGSVDINAITPALPEEETTNNSENIRYIKIDDETPNRQSSEVYRLISPYMSDLSVFEDSIIIEYNCKTYKVLSVLYSDEDGTLGYTDAFQGNVTARDDDSLKDQKVGYWGVDSTGVIETHNLQDLEVVLADYDGTPGVGNGINGGNNYGILAAEITLPEKYPESCTFTITLSPENGSLKTVTIGPGQDLEMRSISHSFQDAIAEGGSGFYLDKNAQGGDILVWVLDTPYQSYSIANKFPEVGIGNITVNVTCQIGEDREEAVSNMEHAYYSEEVTEGTSTGYEVASIRHLNNVRYKTNGTFVQTKDILCRDCYGNILKFTPISDVETKAFSGLFMGMSDGNAYTIYDLTVSANMAGLFSYIGLDGKVYGVTLNYTDEYQQAYANASDRDKRDYFIKETGTRNNGGYAGGIAAKNMGTIDHCSVIGGIIGPRAGTDSSDSKSGIVSGTGVGGICGFNASQATNKKGIVTHCYVAAHVGSPVKSAMYSGGICGINQGEVRYCETGTCLDMNGEIVGKPWAGANVDGDYDYSSSEIVNNVMVVEGHHAGGIVGFNSGNHNPVVSYCVNGAQVIAENQGALEADYAGGIVANNNAKVNYCYNAGLVTGKGRGSLLLNHYLSAGGVVGYQGGGQLTSCYNTGTVMPGANERDFSVYGGIIAGRGGGNVTNCYNVGLVDGKSGQIITSIGASTLFARGTVSNNYGLSVQESTLNDFSFFGTVLSQARMQTQNIAGMVTGTTPELKYVYPHFNVNNDQCPLGEDFHRTPWN